MSDAYSFRKPKLGTRLLFDLFWLMDHLFTETRVNRVLGERRQNLKQNALQEMKAQGRAKRSQIPRVKSISLKSFRQEFLHPCRPVILEGAARDWPCIKRWTPEFISENFGSDRVALIDASPKSLNEVNRDLQYTTLREVVESIREGSKSKYSRFNTILKDHPELWNDFDLEFLKERRNRIATGKTFQVFIGGEGTKTHIHSDSEHNLFTQVYGKKHWLLYPPEYDGILEPVVARSPYFFTHFNPDQPDYQKFPAMEYADSLEGEISAGDILFVPPSYWHHVRNTEDSIGFGFRWFSFIDSFKEDFMMALLMMLSTDPPIWVATQHREDFTKIFTYRQQKMLRKRKGP